MYIRDRQPRSFWFFDSPMKMVTLTMVLFLGLTAGALAMTTDHTNCADVCCLTNGAVRADGAGAAEGAGTAGSDNSTWRTISVAFHMDTEPDSSASASPAADESASSLMNAFDTVSPAMVAKYSGAELVSVDFHGESPVVTFRVPASEVEEYALLFSVLPYSRLIDEEMCKYAARLYKELRARHKNRVPVGQVAEDSLIVLFQVEDSHRVESHDAKPSEEQLQKEQLEAMSTQFFTEFDAVFGTSSRPSMRPLAFAVVSVPKGYAYLYYQLLQLSPYVRSVRFNISIPERRA